MIIVVRNATQVSSLLSDTSHAIIHPIYPPFIEQRIAMSRMFSRSRAALLALVLTLAGVFAAIVVPGSASAAPIPISCKTPYLTHIYWASAGTLQAAMYAPICYGGINNTVWINGGLSAVPNGIGWNVDTTWVGRYNDGRQKWLGVGENLTAKLAGGIGGTISKTPRWHINTNGDNYAFSEN